MAKVVRFSQLPVTEPQAGDTVAAYRDGEIVRVLVPSPGGSGTVTSVGLSMPTGFQVANAPVTSSGTITVTFAEGYGLPTTTQMGQWSTAFGWGDHAQAGYALASAVTSALAGKVDTSDARLTNSREWTASTVSQAEAEAGTATTRRAWTAQRVRQAIAAWWNASAAKSKLDGIQAGATANQTDAYLLNRANHTGTQAASTITGLAPVATSGSYDDLTDKPVISDGTVTSVDISVPTGLQVSGGPITSSGTITISYASGYAIPTTAKQGQWDTAYGWGNHAAQGYLTAASIANMVTTNTAQTITGQKTVTSDLRFDGSAAAYIRPETTGGWARGFWWMTRPTDTPANTRIGGIGVLGSGQTVTKFYIGFGESPWSGSTAEFFPTYSNFKTSLRVDGVEVATKAYAYSKTEVDSLLMGYVTPTALHAYTYDKQTIDDKIDAGGSDSLTLAQAQAIALYF